MMYPCEDCGNKFERRERENKGPKRAKLCPMCRGVRISLGKKKNEKICDNKNR